MQNKAEQDRNQDATVYLVSISGPKSLERELRTM